MLTIFGVYRSKTARPLWLLGETGLPFNHIPVMQAYRLSDAAAPDAPFNTASPAYLQINPMGQVPTLVDGDLVLTESLAICQYLARISGGPLAPQTAAETAMCDQWAFFGATSVEGPALDLLFALSGALPDSAAKIAEKLTRPLARLETALARSNWLIGERFTVADLMVAECLRYAQGHAPLMDAYPQVKDWLARCQSRPAFKAMWEKRMAEPA
jgi:glutathione S-transferase